MRACQSALSADLSIHLSSLSVYPSRPLCPQHPPASRSGVTRKVRPSILGYTIWNLLTVSLLSLTRTLSSLVSRACLPGLYLVLFPLLCIVKSRRLASFYSSFCYSLPVLALVLGSQLGSFHLRLGNLDLAARVLILDLSSVVSCSRHSSY